MEWTAPGCLQLPMVPGSVAQSLAHSEPSASAGASNAMPAEAAAREGVTKGCQWKSALLWPREKAEEVGHRASQPESTAAWRGYRVPAAAHDSLQQSSCAPELTAPRAPHIESPQATERETQEEQLAAERREVQSAQAP